MADSGFESEQGSDIDTNMNNDLIIEIDTIDTEDGKSELSDVPETNIDDEKYFSKLSMHYGMDFSMDYDTSPIISTDQVVSINPAILTDKTEQTEQINNNYNYMNDCNDWSSFVEQIESNSTMKKYNFGVLKTHAYEMIDKLKRDENLTQSEQSKQSGQLTTKQGVRKVSQPINEVNKQSSKSDFNMFKPEESVSIVISELKQLDKMDGVELIIDNSNIYDFQLVCQSDKLKTNIVYNIKLNMMEYPYAPPRINIIKPMMTYNLNYCINTMDCFMLDNWNPTNSVPYIISEITKLVEKYGILSSDQTNSYSVLSNMLGELSILCKIHPQIGGTESINFQIPFVKYNASTDQSTNQKSSNNKTYENNNGQSWKSGTGYGTYGSKKWDIKKYLESDKYKLNKLNAILADIVQHIESQTQEETIVQNLIFDIKQSCLIQYIVMNLTENLDLGYIQTNPNYLINLIKLANIIFNIDTTIFGVYGQKFKNNVDTFTMIQKLSVKSTNSNEQSLIESLIDLYTKVLSVYPDTETEIIETPISDDVKYNYVNQMKKLQWMMVESLPNVCAKKEKLINTLHLCKEISVLSKSLPIDYGSSIYVRVDENNMQSINALIIPSDDTPYAYGCYVFHIFMPETYNKTPPLVQIVTTGNGSVRFNPNLYANGKVCLSLLGTWQGDASESWNESSTLLQVLISIQSLIFIDEPYFNEPGHERSMNSDHGKKASKEYNKNVKINNLTWAMVDMLKNPPKAFENVIKTHFKLKGSKIIEEVSKWATEFSGSPFNAKLNELKDEIAKLT